MFYCIPKRWLIVSKQIVYVVIAYLQSFYFNFVNKWAKSCFFGLIRTTLQLSVAHVSARNSRIRNSRER